jgi:hypothetical protein
VSTVDDEYLNLFSADSRRWLSNFSKPIIYVATKGCAISVEFIGETASIRINETRCKIQLFDSSVVFRKASYIRNLRTNGKESLSFSKDIEFQCLNQNPKR